MVTRRGCPVSALRSLLLSGWGWSCSAPQMLSTELLRLKLDWNGEQYGERSPVQTWNRARAPRDGPSEVTTRSLSEELGRAGPAVAPSLWPNPAESSPANQPGGRGVDHTTDRHQPHPVSQRSDCSSDRQAVSLACQAAAAHREVGRRRKRRGGRHTGEKRHVR
jgi:hypothetical protein